MSAKTEWKIVELQYPIAFGCLVATSQNKLNTIGCSNRAFLRSAVIDNEPRRLELYLTSAFILNAVHSTKDIKTAIKRIPHGFFLKRYEDIVYAIHSGLK